MWYVRIAFHIPHTAFYTQTMNISYKWLQSYFEKPLPEVEKLAEILTLSAFEIEGVEKVCGDCMIDVDVLPNRAHDCLGHHGIAKEIGVLLKLQTQNSKSKTVFVAQKSTLNVDVQDTLLCHRYVGRKINNIKVEESPKWLKERLEAIGQKSINNIVDATNYVMFDLGQPLHAFDADKTDGGIVVRKAENCENITTLDNKELELNNKILVIADGKNPLAIAGIKGGKKAEVDESTTNLVLESANFEPSNIRKTTRLVNIQTDSSKRFENEITPELAGVAMCELTALILKIAGTDKTEVEEVVDIYSNKPELEKINISTQEINKVLGTELSAEEVQNIFERFAFSFEKNEDTFVVEIPYERLDLRIKEDLIEEVGRVYGYEKIEGVPIDFECERVVNRRLYYMNRIREILQNEGYSENYGYTFRDKGDIEMIKSMAQGKDFLRTNLTDGIKEVIEFNDRYKDLLVIDRVRMFEFGTVFTMEKEWMSFAIGLGPSKNKKENNVLELLNEKLGTELSADIFGKQGGVFEINFDDLLEKLPEPDGDEVLETCVDEKIQFKTISPYPFVTRDIAVWTPADTKAESVLELIKKEAGDLLAQNHLFDVYEKDGRVSYAFNLVFQSQERTLTDDEINQIMEKITQKMDEKNWEVR